MIVLVFYPEHSYCLAPLQDGKEKEGMDTGKVHTNTNLKELIMMIKKIQKSKGR